LWVREYTVACRNLASECEIICHQEDPCKSGKIATDWNTSVPDLY